MLSAHLAPESIMVEHVQSIQIGTQIGLVGNSGNTGEPHLYINIQGTQPEGDPISAEPRWFKLDGQLLVRDDSIDEQQRVSGH